MGCPEFDVLIVGAGPAGVSTWLHLKRKAPEVAERTLVIDKAAFPRTKLCGGGVWPWSDALVKRLGIELDIPALSVPDVEFRYRKKSWLFQSPKPFRMVQRADFDMALVAAARQRGMVFHENEPVVDARCEQDALVVRTHQGAYRVKAMVGADGSLSRVRKTMGLLDAACLAPTIQVSAPATRPCDPEFERKRMVIDFSGRDAGLQGYTWHFPCLQGEEAFMHHGIVDFRLLRNRPFAEMKTLFARELQTRNLEGQSVVWSSHPIRRFSDGLPIARPHVLLVGDAAGIEPALGGGIHMALAYGEPAADELVRAIGTRDFSFRHYKEAVMSHLLGRHIRDFTQLARELYNGDADPVNTVREFFTDRLIRSTLSSLLKRQGNSASIRRASSKT